MRSWALRLRALEGCVYVYVLWISNLGARLLVLGVSGRSAASRGGVVRTGQRGAVGLGTYSAIMALWAGVCASSLVESFVPGVIDGRASLCYGAWRGPSVGR